jgi:hypothetical protein
LGVPDKLALIGNNIVKVETLGESCKFVLCNKYRYHLPYIASISHVGSFAAILDVFRNERFTDRFRDTLRFGLSLVVFEFIEFFLLKLRLAVVLKLRLTALRLHSRRER